jgi:hypothetical protein
MLSMMNQLRLKFDAFSGRAKLLLIPELSIDKQEIIKNLLHKQNKTATCIKLQVAAHL